MTLIRRGLSVLLMLVSFLSLGVFLLLWGVRYWAEECEVSQVFRLHQAVHLTGDNFLGIYDVALTPLSGNKIAQTCGLTAITPIKYVNFLDKKVWLLPLEEFQFATDNGPQTRRWNFLLLGFSLIALGLAIPLYKGKEE